MFCVQHARAYSLCKIFRSLLEGDSLIEHIHICMFVPYCLDVLSRHMQHVLVLSDVLYCMCRASNVASVFAENKPQCCQKCHTCMCVWHCFAHLIVISEFPDGHLDFQVNLPSITVVILTTDVICIGLYATCIHSTVLGCFDL